MTNCIWCDEDYKVNEETGLCKWCAEKKVAIQQRLGKEYEIRHGRSSGAMGFDECYGTTHILDFAWAWRVGGQLLNEANYKEALKRLPEDYVGEATVGHWMTPYRCLSIHIWDDEKQMPTPAWDVYVEMQEDMEQYPVLNEELYSQLQSDDLYETIKNCYDYNVQNKIEFYLQGNDDLDVEDVQPEDWVEQILNHPMTEQLWWNEGDDIRQSDIDEIIDDLAQKWIADLIPDPDGIDRIQMAASKTMMKRLL